VERRDDLRPYARDAPPLQQVADSSYSPHCADYEERSGLPN
jgi:hypothetical protein